MDGRRIGDLLVEAGIISRANLEDVFSRAHVVGERRILSELYTLGMANERQLAEVLAKRLGTPVAILGESVIDLDIVKLVPADLLRKHCALPIFADERNVTVVAVDPEAPGLMTPIGFATGRRVVPLLAIHTILEKTVEAALAAVAAGETRLAGKKAQGTEPFVATARHAPPLALAEANAIAQQIVAALTDVPTAAPAEPMTPIGAVRLKQMVLERPKEEPFVIEERIRAISEPAVQLPKPLELDDVMDDKESEPMVLVVDDDEAIRAMLTKALEHDGLSVVSAKDGDEAVALLRLMRPSAVLLDAMLPSLHGFEICASMKRSQLKDIPVIMISAVYKGLEQAREIQEVHGADFFVEKPFELWYVRKLVGEILQRPHMPAPKPALLARLLDDARSSYENHAAHGLFMAAEADVQLWISLDPFDGRAWLERGNLYALAGDLVSAMSAYEAAVVYDARLLIAHLGLAMVCEQLGFERRARATWLKARALAPDDATRASIDKHLA